MQLSASRKVKLSVSALLLTPVSTPPTTPTFFSSSLDLPLARENSGPRFLVVSSSTIKLATGFGYKGRLDEEDSFAKTEIGPHKSQFNILGTTLDIFQGTTWLLYGRFKYFSIKIHDYFFQVWFFCLPALNSASFSKETMRNDTDFRIFFFFKFFIFNLFTNSQLQFISLIIWLRQSDPLPRKQKKFYLLMNVYGHFPFFLELLLNSYYRDQQLSYSFQFFKNWPTTTVLILPFPTFYA